MRRGYAASIVFATACLAALLSSTPSQGAAAPSGEERGTIAVNTASGYARLLFTYPRRSPVAASIADGVLTLRLGEPVNATVDSFTDALKGYVANGRRDADGLTYRFAVTRALALHTSSVLNKTVIDLVPDSFKGVPPDLPPPPPPPVVQAPVAPDVASLKVLPIRVGEYANYTRIVFDWPQRVEYSAFPGRGRISIRFQGLVRPDFSMLQERKPAWVKNAGWRIDGKDMLADFETEPESGFHDFRDGNKIIVDILAPSTDAASYARSAAASAPVPIAPPPAPQKSPSPNPPPAGSDAAAQLKTANTPAQLPPPALPAPSPETPAPVRAASAELAREGGLLRFPQAKGHGVAVFQRGDTAWIVLDGHPAPDVASLIAPLTSIVAKAEAQQVPGAAVLKLVFKTPLMAAVSESDVSLDILFTGGRTSPPEGIALTRQGEGGLSTLRTPLAGARRAVTIFDNEAGDRILVVPARPGKGMLTEKRFVEMAALPSAAGLAVVPFADDLVVRVQNEAVVFSRPQGLLVSSSSGAAAEPIVRLEQGGEGPAYIDFAQWSKGPSQDVYASQRILRASAARLPENESTKARLQLARYLIANDLGSEALGVAGMIAASDAGLARDPSLLAIKGAAEVMMGRYAAALTTLSLDSLANDPHAAFWRGIAAAKTGNYGAARRELLLAKSALAAYPQVWQTRARLARAETGLAQGDLASVSDALDQLPKELPPRLSVEARLYAAELLAEQGHTNEAVARLRTLEGTDYTPIAAKAIYARVETMLNAKKIDRKDAIETLEKLRFRWRGDDLELRTLRKLGNLYFEGKQWREGLTTLRIAAANFPGAELAREAQDDMRRAFSDLFLSDKGNEIPAVQALALFSEFSALTPIGRDGDEMIRRLSDRLAEVDLLAPAAQLLDYQVNQRLEGVARAAVATRLAAIYLLDRRPEDALRILNATRQTRLPDDINAQRRIMEARALAAMKRHDAALALIADETSADAKRLRADIAWEAGNWAVAGTRIEDMLGNRSEDGAALEARERDLVLRAAVAYSLAGDEAKLDALRGRYAEKMNASADAKLFAVVTERIDKQGVAFRDLAGKIAAVDTLQAFMENFRKRGAPATPAKTAAN